jgi:O-antigen/teichoic acid export membrane protein
MAFSVVSRVAGLGALTAAGQLVIVGSLPLYSRIFDPSAYGEYVIFFGTFTVLSVLAGMRYDSAVVLPRDDGLAAAVAGLMLLIGFGVAILIAALTFAEAYVGLFPDLWAATGIDFGCGLAVATALGTMQRSLTGWCIREGRFLLIGWGQFLFCVATVAAQLSLARVSQQLHALIWGFACALGLQTACLASFVLRGRRSPARLSCGNFANAWRSIKLVARKYRRFPTYMVGYALASSARDRLIQLALGIGAGAAVVGRFGLAYRVVFAPNSLVYSAVSPVFFGIASRGDRVSVGRFAAALVETAFVFMVVPYTAFAIEAPSLTEALLSDKWHGTGPYLQALAGPALLLATTCWLDRAFDSFRRQSVAFSLEAGFTLVSVTVVALLSRSIDPVGVVWAFSALALIYYWIYFLATFLACGFPLADFRRACLSAVISAVFALILGFLTHQISHLTLRILAYAVVMVAVIGGWMRYRGGAQMLRSLVQSRVAGRSNEICTG